jgi:hypothetical protein
MDALDCCRCGLKEEVATHLCWDLLQHLLLGLGSSTGRTLLFLVKAIFAEALQDSRGLVAFNVQGCWPECFGALEGSMRGPW